jgi:hypothetical protein
LTASKTIAAGTGALGPFGTVLNIGYDTALGCGITLRPTTDIANSVFFFNASAITVGSISHDSSATAYNTTSSADLKKDLKSFDAGSIIDSTEVYDFAWKSTGERAHGVMAQQANEVYPLAVTHDEKTDWWGVDYSKYVPLLLQELKTLRGRVADLEAGSKT